MRACSAIVLLATVASSCGGANSAVPSLVTAPATPVETVTATDDGTEYSNVEFDEPAKLDQGAAWDELLPTLSPELGGVLPGSDAFNPTWWFDGVEDVALKSAAPSDDCPAETAKKPAGLQARFAMASAFDPALYREGGVELLVLHDDDVNLVADYAAARVASVACLAAALSGGKTLVPITDGLPEHAAAAYNIEYPPTEPADTGIETSVGMTVVQLHYGNTHVQVVVHAIQPLSHPDWIDVEQEALRIAGAIDLDS
jgi:hypothetical protein